MVFPTEHKPIIITLASDTDSTGSIWKVILFNCNCHTFDAVVTQLTRAIQCTQAKAGALAEAAHNNGKVVVFEGPKKRCEKVADVLGSIGLLVAVEE